MKKFLYIIIFLFALSYHIPSCAKEISISEYGAVGDGLTDDTQAFQLALNDSGTLNLEAGKTYRLTTGLLIPSSTIVNGNNSTIIIDDLNFFMNTSNPSENNGKGLFYYQFFFPKNYDSMSELLEINNLSILWNVSKRITNVNTYYLFLINDIDTVNFQSVSITIKGNANNSIQPIKFNTTASKVTLDNCSISNYCHGSDGSCVWFHANSPSGYQDVNIMNSYFYSEAHDEIISTWGPYKKHINIENCDFLRYCVPCLSSDKKNTTTNNICFVSKTTSSILEEYQSNIDASSSITYTNCNFNITSQSKYAMPLYFITSSSYYGTPIKTYFKNCNINGSFAKGFISGESNSSETLSTISNSIYRTNIGISFDKCNLNIDAPALITTRSTNTTFKNCHINVTNALADMFYADNKLLACSYYSFINNNITVANNITSYFKDINSEQYNQIYVYNNVFYFPNTSTPLLYTLSTRDYSSFEKIHYNGAKSSFTFLQNSLLFY